MTEVFTRAYEFRADSIDPVAREISGVAVPYERDAEIGGAYVERIARGAIGDDSNSALLFWRHSDPIGKLVAAQSTDDGWQIRARVSDTAAGTDALTLARDGVVTQLSIGFTSDEDTTETRASDGALVVTRTRIRVREVSLVPFGAYADGASITEVRSTTPSERTPAMTDSAPITTEAPDLTDLRAQVDELERRSTQFVTRDDEPVTDMRSAAEIVKAIAAGDEQTIRRYNELHARAYTGGTTADAIVKDGWVGDLTRLIDSTSGALASIFAQGTLPATGMNVEYGQLDVNTIQVTEQAAEGDNLAYGKVSVKTQTAPVKTFGGYTQLTRQEIERSSVPVLQTNLDALALAAGARIKTSLHAAFATAVAAQTGIAANGGVVLLGSTLTAATYNNWVSALVDAAVKYSQGIALPMDALIVSASVFKKLAGLSGSDSRPMLSLDGSGANTVGRLNVTALNGTLAGVPVVLDADQSGDSAVFVNGRAITVYKSPLVSLQDDNIVNLSKDFSVYQYAAFAPTIPGAIVPLKLAAS